MLDAVKQWCQRNFSNPDLVMLFVSLAVLAWLVIFFGGMLAPVIASIIIAYLLDGMVKRLQLWKVPHGLAVLIVWLVFVSLVVLIILFIIPLLWQQLANLVTEMPHLVTKGEKLLLRLPQRYPDFITATQVQNFMNEIQSYMTTFGKTLLSYSFRFIPGIIEFVIYFVLVPLLVFFFLKDSQVIWGWVSRFIPKNRRLMSSVWSEVNEQLSVYVRSKFLEVVIVAVTTTIVFWIMGLHYSLLLGLLVGAATIIPFVGAIVVTIPIVIVAFLQWGMSMQVIYLLIAYAVIGVLDGNVLVPILFSETMKLHPLATLIAVLVFGGLWGFWGVFFAIPLLTLFIAVLNAWADREGVSIGVD